MKKLDFMKGVLNMKKNKTMRAAGGLLIATLLSTSIVSGTFAKYVTTGEANDTARVAKFGVEVKSSGGLFAKTYKTTDNVPGSSSDSNSATSIALSVVSSDDSNVVAPGTKSATDGLTFSVTGTPEVAVKVDFSYVEDNLSDVWLGLGNYPNLTTSTVYDDEYTASDVFTIAAGASGSDNAYYPIKYTLTQTTTGTNGKTTNLVNKGTMKDVATQLKTLKSTYSKTYAPGTNLSEQIGTFKLTWEWDFDDSSKGTYDKQDTFLGDAAASADTISTAVTSVNTAITAYNKANASSQVTTLPTTYTKAEKGMTAAANSYNLNTAFNVTISVTQVD
jgi:hypothetical protein